MFDKYLICEDGLRNVTGDGGVSGFELDVRIAYYRGLGLTMVEGFDVTVDGERFRRDDLVFRVHGNSYSLDDLETADDDRWGFTERATLRVRRSGGLGPGPHEVTMTEHLRISYMPAPSVTTDTKTLQLLGSG